MISTANATFKDILRETSPELQTVAWKTRELILTSGSKCVEMISVKDRVAGYGASTLTRDQLVYIALPKEWVRIGFYYGGDLPDPEGLLEGEGKRMRHIKIGSEKELENPALKELVRLALERNQLANK
jgi:hypothetical protein